MRRGAILAALAAVLLVGGTLTWRVVDAQGHSTTIPASFAGTWKGTGPTSDGSTADFTSSLSEGLQLGRLSSGSSSCYGGPLTVSDATSSRLTTRFAPDGTGCNAWTVVFTHLSGGALQMAVDPDNSVNHESRFEIRMTRQG